MRVHFDVLGWIYVLTGAIGLATGVSLGILATGTSAALADIGAPSGDRATVWVLGISALVFVAGGVALVAIGRALIARRPRGRPSALIASLPLLLVIPFGTALAAYTFWVLLNDDGRREFGRATRQG